MVSTEKPESRTVSSSVYSMSRYSENQYSCIRLRSTAIDLEDAAIQAAHNVRPAWSADSSTWSSAARPPLIPDNGSPGNGDRRRMIALGSPQRRHQRCTHRVNGRCEIVEQLEGEGALV